MINTLGYDVQHKTILPGYCRINKNLMLYTRRPPTLVPLRLVCDAVEFLASPYPCLFARLIISSDSLLLGRDS